jgi:RNase P subunit RPR2
VSTAPQIFCRSCASPLVQASNWEQDERSSWHVRLWCPECGFERRVVLDKAQAGYLSAAIEAGFALLLEALEEFQRFQVRAGKDSTP